ncbi:MAG: PLP-dependent aminotransferase family protein [Candidatus Acidiferrales bacterium]
MQVNARSATPLYIRIAETFAHQVANGAFRAGDRVPSLRKLSREQGVSLSTALQAYLWLENRGYLEARPQSGFYIRTPFAKLIPEPQFEAGKTQPATLGINAVLEDVIRSGSDPAFVPFGTGGASAELLPNRRLNLIMRRILRHQPLHSANYGFPSGVEAFRRQIAKRSLAMRCEVSPRDVVVTGGAMEAINLSLRAVAQPGDVIAVESPIFFGILQSVAALKMKIIEIPAHPQRGMDLERLERAIRQHKIKACIAMPNCHNPLGYVSSDKYKRALVDLTARMNVPLIEDDVYGDLAYDGPRPLTAKSFDHKGLVLLCSSFSKILSPGYRIGWSLPGRFRAEVERLKLVTSIAAPPLPQLVLAEFLESASYDRHLRRLRATVACQMESVRQAIAKYFPAGTRISRPAGGYMLWVELPERVDALKLHHAALGERICIVPGTVFSATGRYKNYIRINCGHAWTDAHDRALLTLGRLCDRQL